MGDFDARELHLKTKGRRTGKLHQVELWFASQGNKLYFLAHRDSDWWKNLTENSEVEVKVGSKTYSGKARIANITRETVFEMFRRKYGESVIDDWYGGSRADRQILEIELL